MKMLFAVSVMYPNSMKMMFVMAVEKIGSVVLVRDGYMRTVLTRWS